MSDYLGYNRNVQSDQIISADNAIIDIGKGRIGLVQSFTGQYNHQIEPRFELGSSDLFWVNGKPSGQFQIQKLVGREGLLDAFRTGNDACGGLRQISVTLDGGSCEVKPGPGVNFSGAKLQSVGIQGNGGAFDITESATFVVAEMS